MTPLHLTPAQRKRLVAIRDETTDLATYRRAVSLLALADGTPVAQMASWFGVTRQSLYNWTERFSAEGGPSALQTRPHPGRPPLWDEDCTVLLRASLHQRPEEFGYPSSHWTVGLLQELIGRCLGQKVSDITIRRHLHQLGYVWKRPRYVLKPDPAREKKAPLAPVVLAFAQTQRGSL